MCFQKIFLPENSPASKTKIKMHLSCSEDCGPFIWHTYIVMLKVCLHPSCLFYIIIIYLFLSLYYKFPAPSNMSAVTSFFQMQKLFIHFPRVLAVCLMLKLLQRQWCFSPTGRVVFHMPDWLHHVMAAGRILFRNTFDTYMDHYMQSRLDQILQEHRMVSLITQLRGTQLCRGETQLTPQQHNLFQPLSSKVHKTNVSLLTASSGSRNDGGFRETLPLAWPHKIDRKSVV